MGIGDFVSDITPDAIEDAVEGGVEWVGNRVEDAGNWTADRLDDVGWDSASDWVREQSRSVANRMGAEVEEMDLGQTEDKTRLVYGSPGKIRSTAKQLRAFQKAFDDAGSGLKGLDSSRLKGEAADALRTAVSTQPPKWFTGADACEKAAAAMESFADTVTWAQHQAQTAIDVWKEGIRAPPRTRPRGIASGSVTTTRPSTDTTRWPRGSRPKFSAALPRADVRRPGQIAHAGCAGTPCPGPRAAEHCRGDRPRFHPRRARHGSGKAVVRTAGDQWSAGATDHQRPRRRRHRQGCRRAGELRPGVNPPDPYNITHPAGYTNSLNSLAAGLVVAANDPVGTGKQMVSDFMKDPAEGFGRLLPDTALSLATGGGGSVVKGVRLVEDMAKAFRARRLLDDAPHGAHNRPDGRRVVAGTDPVDLASGRMFLPQTDLVLPGTLPLVFTRRTVSSRPQFNPPYRAP